MYGPLFPLRRAFKWSAFEWLSAPKFLVHRGAEFALEKDWCPVEGSGPTTEDREEMRWWSDWKAVSEREARGDGSSQPQRACRHVFLWTAAPGSTPPGSARLGSSAAQNRRSGGVNCRPGVCTAERERCGRCRDRDRGGGAGSQSMPRLDDAEKCKPLQLRNFFQSLSLASRKQSWHATVGGVLAHPQ